MVIKQSSARVKLIALGTKNDVFVFILLADKYLCQECVFDKYVSETNWHVTEDAFETII